MPLPDPDGHTVHTLAPGPLKRPAGHSWAVPLLLPAGHAKPAVHTPAHAVLEGAFMVSP